jgi:BMFP domain-containing protein YqiC
MTARLTPTRIENRIFSVLAEIGTWPAKPGASAMTEERSRPNLDDLASRLAASVPQNLRELGQDLEKSFRSLLQSGFERMDLVTREEFDLQTAVLERTREKLDKLEARVAELEKRD